MSDYSKLKELAEAAIEQSDNIGEAAWYTADCLQHLLHAGAPDADFIAAANPAVVLGLIADLDGYKQGAKVEADAADEARAEVRRLKAELEEAKAQSSDVWGLAQSRADTIDQLKAENERLRAEVAGLRTGYEAYEQVNAELKAEAEGLRREREGKVLCDLELFETLRDSANTEADEHRQCMATYRPLRQANLDSVVKKCDDLLAAMGKGEQS
ncbi:hypothetical protein [Pseudomonas lactis]|uniref:hypothetical protein n=1 Tax=Pseudomonas lactis TaxID=1615674 RepID=UPI00110C74F1|nr:hypothetical protein [Pseudomonas lactis]